MNDIRTGDNRRARVQRDTKETQITVELDQFTSFGDITISLRLYTRRESTVVRTGVQNAPADAVGECLFKIPGTRPQPVNKRPR